METKKKTVKPAVKTATKKTCSAAEKLQWLMGAISQPATCVIDQRATEFRLLYDTGAPAAPGSTSGGFRFAVTAMSTGELIEKAVQLDKVQRAFQAESAAILGV